MYRLIHIKKNALFYTHPLHGSLNENVMLSIKVCENAVFVFKASIHPLRLYVQGRTCWRRGRSSWFRLIFGSSIRSSCSSGESGTRNVEGRSPRNAYIVWVWFNKVTFGLLYLPLCNTRDPKEHTPVVFIFLLLPRDCRTDPAWALYRRSELRLSSEETSSEEDGALCLCDVGLIGMIWNK